MPKFKATIQIIGINPYVLLPDAILQAVFKQAGKDKGPIPVNGTIDGHAYTQTLVKYSGHWRLYLNGPMRKAAGKEVGDTASFSIAYDPADRSLTMHPKLQAAIAENKKAKAVFDTLPASRQKEIVRYISFLKTEESIDHNVTRAIQFLLGKERFIGKDKPWWKAFNNKPQALSIGLYSHSFMLNFTTIYWIHAIFGVLGYEKDLLFTFCICGFASQGPE